MTWQSFTKSLPRCRVLKRLLVSHCTSSHFSKALLSKYPQFQTPFLSFGLANFEERMLLSCVCGTLNCRGKLAERLRRDAVGTSFPYFLFGSKWVHQFVRWTSWDNNWMSMHPKQTVNQPTLHKKRTSRFNFWTPDILRSTSDSIIIVNIMMDSRSMVDVGISLQCTKFASHCVCHDHNYKIFHPRCRVSNARCS